MVTIEFVKKSSVGNQGFMVYNDGQIARGIYIQETNSCKVIDYLEKDLMALTAFFNTLSCETSFERRVDWILVGERPVS